MNKVIAAFLQSATVALADQQQAEAKGPVTLREAALRVQMANRVTAQWQHILAEGCGFAALARDELTNLLVVVLDTPIDLVILPAMMQRAPRAPCLYPNGASPGAYAALRDFARAHGVAPMFNGALAAYIRGFIERCQPSQIVPEAAPFGYDAEEDWTRVNNKVVREALRWLSYTAAYPFLVVNARMLFYGGADYASITASFRTILRNEGFSGLFKGHTVSVLQTVVSLLFGEQYVALFEVFYPLQLLQMRMALDTQRLQTPFAAASEIYQAGGFSAFMTGFKAALFNSAWTLLNRAVIEGLMLLTFGFKQHSSPRTVPQRARTALRRWLGGEREEDRQARIEDFKRKNGSARDILANDAAKDAGSSA